MEAVGVLLFSLIYRTVRIAWRLLKIVLFLAIIGGAIRSLTSTSLPVVGDIVSWAHNAPLTFFGAPYIYWIAENWWVFAISYIYITVAFLLRPGINELSETGGYQRLFIGTMMNYFQVRTETESMKILNNEGVLSVMKQGLYERIFYAMLGQKPPDDALDANAMRAGKEVSLLDDLKEAAERQRDNGNVTIQEPDEA